MHLWINSGVLTVLYELIQYCLIQFLNQFIKVAARTR
jgi:hypothetical protein